MQEKTVATPNAAHQSMAHQWDMIDALMGGTETMRRAGSKYLEKWEAESDPDYRNRLARATLVPIYSETIANMTGRVFAKPVTANDDFGPKVQGYIEDFDGIGHDLNEFAAGWFYNALALGLYYTLVDSTHVPDAQTLADMKIAGARAYATLIHPRNVLGWKVSDDRKRLLQVRIEECYYENDGEFDAVEKTQIRVINAGTSGGKATWETFRETDAGIWVGYEKGSMGTADIPLVPLYTRQTGWMRAQPPLLDLAYLNIKHWNEQSDQDISVRFARVRMGFIIGVEDTYTLKLSADSFTRLPKDADAKIVQGSAESVEIGRKELDALKKDMRECGARLLDRDNATIKTVTQSQDEAIQEQSVLGRMGQALEDALDQVAAYMAEIEGESQVGSVKVNGNYSIDFDPTQTIDVLNKMAISGSISRQTAFEEAQRRGVISDHRSWDEESQLIDAQGQPLGLMTADAGAGVNANGQ